MKKMAMVALTALAMVGCGGGSSSSSSNGTGGGNEFPVGLYTGATVGGEEFLQVLFTDDRSVYAVYGVNGDDDATGVLKGDVTLSVVDDLEIEGKDYSFVEDVEGWKFTISKIDYRKKISISGKLFRIGGDGFMSDFSLSYEKNGQPIEKAQIAGSYEDDIGTSTVVEDDGLFTVTYADGCEATGEIGQGAGSNGAFYADFKTKNNCGTLSNKAAEGVIIKKDDDEGLAGIFESIDGNTIFLVVGKLTI